MARAQRCPFMPSTNRRIWVRSAAAEGSWRTGAGTACRMARALEVSVTAASIAAAAASACAGVMATPMESEAEREGGVTVAGAAGSVASTEFFTVIVRSGVR